MCQNQSLTRICFFYLGIPLLDIYLMGRLKQKYRLMYNQCTPINVQCTSVMYNSDQYRLLIVALLCNKH